MSAGLGVRVVAVGEALPPHVYSQREITARLAELLGESMPDGRLLERLHHNVGVERRHLALPLEAYAELRDFDRANDAWIEAALDLGARAIDDALERAGLRRDQVDDLLVASVTGVASPSLDARLINRMGLRRDLHRMPLFGLGCVAGAAGVSRAADLLVGRPGRVAIVLAVELCSLTLQTGDASTANLISTGLFGDGAAAAVLVGEDVPVAGGVEVVATRSVLYPDTEDVMGWDIGSRGFSIVLSPAVPSFAGERLPADVDAFLADHGLARGDVARWICHPGGPKVLRALQDGFDLSDDDLAISWATLRRCGNLSSASVLLILRQTMAERSLAVGEWGVLLAMGPGFCSELVLLRGVGAAGSG